MLNPHLIFGLLGVLFTTVISPIVYLRDTWKGGAKPNLTSWFLWMLNGYALFLTYWSSSETKDNVLPAIAGITNPTIILVAALWKHGAWKFPSVTEMSSLMLGCLTLVFWWNVRQEQSMVQWALYLAIATDIIAGIPTVEGAWKRPSDERALPWTLFLVGFSFAIAATSELSVAALALPVYMCTLSVLVIVPVVSFRVRKFISRRKPA